MQAGRSLQGDFRVQGAARLLSVFQVEKMDPAVGSPEDDLFQGALVFLLPADAGSAPDFDAPFGDQGLPGPFISGAGIPCGSGFRFPEQAQGGGRVRGPAGGVLPESAAPESRYADHDPCVAVAGGHMDLFRHGPAVMIHGT